MGKPVFGLVRIGAGWCVIQVTHSPAASAKLPRLWPWDGRAIEMAPKRSRLFQDLVSQTAKILEDRGLSVLPTAVASVIDGLIESAAQRTALSQTELLRLIVPEQVADLIGQAQRRERHASVRPLREDTHDIDVPSTASGQLINALSQTTKMAATNGDRETAVHAADLLSEFGVGMVNAGKTAVS